jgi:hypothetical protein
MVEVKLKFTPIQKFRPEILKNPTADDNTLGNQYYFGKKTKFLSTTFPSPTQNNTTTDIITNSEGEYQDDLINKYPTFTEGIDYLKSNPNI